MEYMNHLKNSIEEDKESTRYFVESAKALVRGGSLFGRKVDSENLEDVIASLYVLYLEESHYRKSLKAERDFYLNV